MPEPTYDYVQVVGVAAFDRGDGRIVLAIPGEDLVPLVTRYGDAFPLFRRVPVVRVHVNPSCRKGEHREVRHHRALTLRCDCPCHGGWNVDEPWWPNRPSLARRHNPLIDPIEVEHG